MRNNSVFKKLLTYLIGGTLFAITLSFIFKLSFINSTFKNNQDVYVQNVGKFSSPNLATFLWNVDNDAVKTMLAGLNQIYKIPKCEVINEKGELIAEIKNKELDSNLKALSFEIFKDGKNMGKLNLYYNYTETNKNVMKFLYYEILMAVLIFSVLTIVAFVFIKNRVLWHLSLLMYKLKQIAKGEGDLRTRIDIVTKDELGEASRAFNFFVNRIESIIVRIKKTSAYINEMTDELTKRIYILSENLAQQSASFEEVSTAIQETAEHATQANQISKNSTTKINNISEDMIKTITAIHDISKSSRKINDFINIITDIADQTNLLALNAAIEAARAGEHGKGFAIVADEVRKLAEKSASSAKEITSLISVSVEDVEKGIKTSEVANTNITEIFNDIQLMVEKVERISNTSSEQAAAMEENTSITSKMSEASNDLGKFSEELKQISNDLNELVEMFKTR